MPDSRIVDRFGNRFRDRSETGIIWEADFENDFPLSTGSNAKEHIGRLAQRGLLFTRASAATVQTGASSVVTAIAVDEPRFGLYGLVIEEARTNLVLQARDRNSASWTAGTGSTTDGYALGPDGTTLVDRQVCSAGQFGKYQSPTAAPSTGYVVSQWARRGAIGVASSLGQYVQDSGTALFTSSAYALTDNWGRVTLPAVTTGAGTSGITFSACDGRTLGGLTATARDAVVDMAQIEAGKFATEAIITTGAAATRSGDLLNAEARRMVSNGAVSLEMRFVPKGLVTDYANGFYLACNASNTSDASQRFYAWINNANSRLYLRVNGVDWNPTTAIVWAVGDTVDFSLVFGGKIAKAFYRRNGGAPVFLGETTSIPGPVNPVVPITMFGNTAAQPTSVWAKRIRAYAPGRLPSWVS